MIFVVQMRPYKTALKDLLTPFLLFSAMPALMTTTNINSIVFEFANSTAIFQLLADDEAGLGGLISLITFSDRRFVISTKPNSCDVLCIQTRYWYRLGLCIVWMIRYDTYRDTFDPIHDTYRRYSIRIGSNIRRNAAYF